jgi:hypothetical protein
MDFADLSPSPLSSDLPDFFTLLSEDDQRAYHSIRDSLVRRPGRGSRNKSGENFREDIRKIRDYVVRSDDADNLRGLVCGLLWRDRGIAINIKQLRVLTGKCKSSINSAFQNLGFGTIPTGADVSGEIAGLFPFMTNRFDLVRHWTLRQRTEDSPTVTPEDDDITPPPSSELRNCPFVSAYLSGHCTLSVMVAKLLESQSRNPAPGKAEVAEKRPIEEDALCFCDGDLFLGDNFTFDSWN